jgi:hypothetical protein
MSTPKLCAAYSRAALSQSLRGLLVPVGGLSTEPIAVAESKLGGSSPIGIGLPVCHDILPGSQSAARLQQGAFRLAYSGFSEPRRREPRRQETSVLRGARGL